MFDPITKMQRPISGGLGRLEQVPSGGAMWGEAVIRQPGAPGKCAVEGCGCGEVHFIARNKLTGQGLRHIVNMIGLGSAVNTTSIGIGLATTTGCRVGTGTGATTDGTTALATQVNTAPNTASTVCEQVSAGVYRFRGTYTWNAGTLTAITVTEIGFFCAGTMSVINSGSSQGTLLVARISTTDAEFAGFVVNTAVPLAIEYRLTYTFV